MVEQFCEKQFIPGPNIEAREEMEAKLFGRIYDEMQEIAERTQYRYRRRGKGRTARNLFNRRIDKNFLLPLRNKLSREFPEYKMLIYTLANLDRACKWQHVATRLLSEKIENKSEAQAFWDKLLVTSRLFHKQGIAAFNRIKHGIIGQAGICLALQRLNIPYKVARPTQDANEKTDILAEGQAFQIKHGGKKGKQVKIKPIKVVFYPSVSIETPKQEINYVSSDLEKISTVEENSEIRSKNIGKEVNVFRVVCPLGSFNEDTAEPTPAFLKQIEPKIKKYLPQGG